MSECDKSKEDRIHRLRLVDAELRLITIHKMRLGLLQQAHDLEKTKIYDDEFYVEANEILNDVENEVWKKIYLYCEDD